MILYLPHFYTISAPRLPHLSNITLSASPILPYPIHRIASKAHGCLHSSKPHCPVRFICHHSRLQLSPGFPLITQPILQQWFIHCTRKPVFLQDPHPCEIIFMAFLMFHRKFQGNISEKQYWGTVNLILAKQHAVWDPLMYRYTFSQRNAIKSD